MKKKHLTWDDVETAVERLAINILNSDYKITRIHGIPRGGMIPAVMLSHRLKIPMLIGSNAEDLNDGLWLAVDDICDSGKTLLTYNQKSNWVTATLHHKIDAVTEPHFWWKMASKDEWIVYPWESKDAHTVPDYTLNA